MKDNPVAKEMVDTFDVEHLVRIQSSLDHIIWVTSHKPPRWWILPIVFQLLNSRIITHKMRVWLAHKTWKEADSHEK